MWTIGNLMILLSWRSIKL